MTPLVRPTNHVWFSMLIGSLALGCTSTATVDGDGGSDGASSVIDGYVPPGTEDPGCPDIGLTAPKVYYVCDCQAGADAGCVAGSDANAGTKASPWRTYGKARDTFAQLAAGETIAFCRGGSFTVDGDRRWVNASCKADQPCVVRDYDPAGTGELAKPILRAATGDGFALDDGAAADHEEGYTFLNLDLRSDSGGQTGNGFFIYNDIDDVLACGTDLDGFAIGFHSAGSNAPAAGSDGKNSRVVLSHARVTNNGEQGYLGGGDGCGVEYSTFINNGFKDPVLDHNIYFGPRGADGMFARYNDLYRSSFIDGACEAVSLIVHGRATNLVIEGNHVHESLGAASAGCWGIGVDTGYAPEEEAFTNVTIRNNLVVNVGNVGIGVNACQSCVIENNVVIQEQPTESVLISVPDRERSSDDQALARVTVRNNTLFASSSAKVTGIALGGEGTEHVAVSNVFAQVGTGTLGCFAYDLPDASYTARANNVCANATEAPTLFTSTSPPYDFVPSPSSALVNAGHASLSSMTDIAGTVRSLPDIGAYER